jgi:hypothetical protein
MEKYLKMLGRQKLKTYLLTDELDSLIHHQKNEKPH